MSRSYVEGPKPSGDVVWAEEGGFTVSIQRIDNVRAEIAIAVNGSVVAFATVASFRWERLRRALCRPLEPEP